MINYSDLAEQGDPITGYEENGPYHCEDCVHRLSKTSNICIHPMIKANPKLANRRVMENGKVKGVKVNLEIGCCSFVKQPKGHGQEHLKKEQKEHGESRLS